MTVFFSSCYTPSFSLLFMLDIFVRFFLCVGLRIGNGVTNHYCLVAFPRYVEGGGKVSGYGKEGERVDWFPTVGIRANRLV